jgi:hypothetical protein
VAYYPFNGNTVDESGNGNNLTNYGATLCADRFGNPNQAYLFDGTNYIGSSSPPLTQTDDWTLSAWMRPASLSQATAYAVCVGYDTGTAGDGYGMGISGGQEVGGNSGQSGNYFYTFFPGLGFIPTGFAFTSTNQWYQVIMVRSNGTVMCYVNGEFTTNSLPILPPGNTIGAPTAFAIGSGGSSARFFAGAINDVRIYKIPLSGSEIQQLYNYEVSACTNSGATATAAVSDGFVISATVTYNGCGYTNTPLVQILGGGGTGATATALVTNGFVDGIMITDAGNGYTSTPSIFISPPGGCIPHSATATLTESNGFVIAATVTDPGCGYTNSPSVQILGGGGTGAAATAVVTNGEVVQIIITDAGIGYTNTPSAFINSPIGAQIGLVPALVPMFSNLSVGLSYQLQSSTDLITWTTQGPAFVATNTTMYSSQYFNVPSTNQLYFRLQGAP